jgi:hypothetical protein
LGTFLTPGSGIRDGRKSVSGSGIRDEQPGSCFLELRNHFFLLFWGLKYLNSLTRIRDPGWKKVGSGIRDKHPGSATLVLLVVNCISLGTITVKHFHEGNYPGDEIISVE